MGFVVVGEAANDDDGEADAGHEDTRGDKTKDNNTPAVYRKRSQFIRQSGRTTTRCDDDDDEDEDEENEDDETNARKAERKDILPPSPPPRVAEEAEGE